MSTDHPVIYVDLIEDEPISLEEYKALHPSDHPDANYDVAYASYRENFQPFRWHSKRDGNFEILGLGERYFNEADAEHNIRTQFDQNTIVYLRRRERGNELLRMAYPNDLGQVVLLGPDVEADPDGNELRWLGRRYVLAEDQRDVKTSVAEVIGSVQ